MAEMPDGFWYVLTHPEHGDREWNVSLPISARQVAVGLARQFRSEGMLTKIAFLAFTSIEDFDG